MNSTKLDSLQKDPLVKSYLDTVDGKKILSYYRVTDENKDRYDVSSELICTYEIMGHDEFKKWEAKFHAETLALIESRGNEIIESLKTA